MARDNTDQIPIDGLTVVTDDGAWRLLLKWRRKDKMRSVVRSGDELRVEFEKVSWGDGVWLWAVIGERVLPWAHIPPNSWEFVRREKVGAGYKSIHAVTVGAPDASEFGLLIARPTVRSAIRKYTLEQEPEPEPTPTPDPDMPEPASLLDTVKEVRARYGTPLSNLEMGALLNEVAWRHRADGWGLAAKPAGAHTLQPSTGVHVSRDLLVHAPTATMYDVLQDVAGAATPVWGDPIPMDLAFVTPVAPEGGEPDDEPPSGNGETVAAIAEQLQLAESHLVEARRLVGEL